MKILKNLLVNFHEQNLLLDVLRGELTGVSL
jgi:hypothetical protein